MNPPALGFVGTGWIGRDRMAAILSARKARVAAILDPSPAARRAALDLAREHQEERPVVAGELDELLALGLDGIVVATPNAHHAAAARAALRGNLPVFVQKPLGLTAEEVERTVEEARAADRLLGVDLTYRDAAPVALVRRHLEEGAIGRPYAMDLSFHNAYGPDKPWYFDPDLAGGGCLLDLGVHLLDLAIWLSEPELTGVQGHVFAGGERLDGTSRRSRRPLDDLALAELTFADGSLARVACSWRVGTGEDAAIMLNVHGTEGTLRVRNEHGTFHRLVAERLDGNRCERLLADDAWGGQRVRAWADRLASGDRGFDPEVKASVSVARVIDTLYEGKTWRSSSLPAPALEVGS